MSLTFGPGSLAFFASLIGWSRATAAYREQVSVFFARMHRPVDFEREVGRANDLRQLIVLGGFLLLVGTLVLCITPFTGSLAGAAQTLGVGAFMLLAGAWMFRLGRAAKCAAESECGVEDIAGPSPRAARTGEAPGFFFGRDDVRYS